MYILFDEQIIDSEEIRDLIEKNSDFKVERDMCKASKREDVLAYLLTLDAEIVKEQIKEEYDLQNIDIEELFEEYMSISEERAMELEDLMPMYSIMTSRSYKLDMTENKIKTIIVAAHTDLGLLKLNDVLNRLLSATD